MMKLYFCLNAVSQLGSRSEKILPFFFFIDIVELLAPNRADEQIINLTRMANQKKICKKETRLYLESNQKLSDGLNNKHTNRVNSTARKTRD